MNRVVWLCYMMAQGLGAKTQHFRKPPRGIQRPKHIEEKKQQKFATPEEVKQFLSGAKSRR